VKGVSPRRTCIGCRRTAAPAALVRVHRASDGRLALGPGPGRGAWLCGESPGSCLDRAQRRGGLARALRAPVGLGDVDDLRAKLGR
jgi:predicted RNA-binding protein YlxR (DUF448 family)